MAHDRRERGGWGRKSGRWGRKEEEERGEGKRREKEAKGTLLEERGGVEGGKRKMKGWGNLFGARSKYSNDIGIRREE